MCDDVVNLNISIHAPPRGATGIRMAQQAMQKFQFTPLREGRPCSWRLLGVLEPHFNSRPSARGDGNLARSITADIISIHAPPRGATPGGYTPGRPFIFQFTPLREGRRTTKRYFPQNKIFQFTPLREGRHAYKQQVETEKKFQFTPLREGRHSLSPSSRVPCHFNSRPSARGDGKARTGRHRTRYFNSRPSARGDTASFRTAGVSGVFQFTPLREGRREPSLHRAVRRHFNSRPSARGD